MSVTPIAKQWEAATKEARAETAARQLFEARARARSNEAAPAPAPAQEFAPLYEARACSKAPAPAQEIAPLHEARARNNAPAPAQEIAPLKKTLSLPLNKPHTKKLVGADGSKDADNKMAAATQGGADSTVAAIAREYADTAVMAVRVASRAQRTIARHQRKTSTRTTTRIPIGNKRFGNYHMAAGDPAAGEL